MKTAAVLMTGLLAATAARADEAKVEAKDLPRPVLAAVKAKFPGAKVVAAAKEGDGGKAVFEVAVEDDGRQVEVAVTPKGKVLEVETSVEPGELPKSVRKAVRAKYPEATIKAAAEVVKSEGGAEGRVLEVVLARAGEDDVEVKFAPRWKPVDDGAGGKTGKKPRKKGKAAAGTKAKAKDAEGEG